MADRKRQYLALATKTLTNTGEEITKVEEINPDVPNTKKEAKLLKKTKLMEAKHIDEHIKNMEAKETKRTYRPKWADADEMQVHHGGKVISVACQVDDTFDSIKMAACEKFNIDDASYDMFSTWSTILSEKRVGCVGLSVQWRVGWWVGGRAGGVCVGGGGVGGGGLPDAGG